MVSLLHAASLPVRFFSLSARQQINLSPKFLLLVGAVDFGSLDRLGLVEVLPRLGRLEAMFRFEKSICTTGF